MRRVTPNSAARLPVGARESDSTEGRLSSVRQVPKPEMLSSIESRLGSPHHSKWLPSRNRRVPLGDNCRVARGSLDHRLQPIKQVVMPALREEHQFVPHGFTPQCPESSSPLPFNRVGGHFPEPRRIRPPFPRSGHTARVWRPRGKCAAMVPRKCPNQQISSVIGLTVSLREAFMDAARKSPREEVTP